MTCSTRGASPRLAGLGSLISAIATIAALSSPTAAQTVSDNTFLDTNWALYLFWAGNFTAGSLGSTTATQVAVGGNPGAFRNVTNVLDAAPPGLQTIVVSMSIYRLFVYDPGVSGAITSINYSEDAACTAGCFGQGQSTGPALLQGANIYILSSSTVVTGPALTWANHTLTGLTAADFGLVRVMSNGTLFDNTNHPNFSAGAPIVFGFFRANGTGVSGPGYTLSAGIDNWRVTIAAAGLPVAAALPTLGGWALALLAFGIALIGFAWTRRAR
ncbi:MAG: hypothetical protein E6H67_11780 [Betaproteobacteria bacterium]|nr:MAG: hypothetical protein E6H67_11780 [Betaproteobacteria bacterium]